MDNQTGKLGLPYILPGQAQKHVTHNESLQILDAVIQLTLQSLDISTPPLAPEAGQAWFVASTASGAWEGHSNEIAIWSSGAWQFLELQNGWHAWIEDRSAFQIWNQGAWQLYEMQNLAQLGLNSTADTTNRLTLSSAASLFNHEGAGHQVKINKDSDSDTASVLFQTAFSGRAEMGTTGNDDFQIKVSSNGTVWKNALNIDTESGQVTFPQSAQDKLLDTLKFGDYSQTQNNNWFQLCYWETGGNYNATTAIFDVSHRSSLTFHTLKLRFEKQTHGFVSCELKAEGDSFTDGEEYLLVATNANSRVTLYHRRVMGHYAERYMTLRHMWKQNELTTLEFAKINTGQSQPIGDLETRILNSI